MPGTETGQTEATKQCKRCGERKPVDKFHNSPPHKHKDLRDSVCAACRAEIYQESGGTVTSVGVRNVSGTTAIRSAREKRSASTPIAT